jgi:hypothetical protein
MVTCPQAVIEAALSVCHAVMMPVGSIRLLFRAPKRFPDGQKVISSFCEASPVKARSAHDPAHLYRAATQEMEELASVSWGSAPAVFS